MFVNRHRITRSGVGAAFVASAFPSPPTPPPPPQFI